MILYENSIKLSIVMFPEILHKQQPYYSDKIKFFTMTCNEKSEELKKRRCPEMLCRSKAYVTITRDDLKAT